MSKPIRINPVVSKEAYDIVQKIPKLEKGKWVSEAIVEKHNRQNGEVFTDEQKEWIRKEIALGRE